MNCSVMIHTAPSMDKTSDPGKPAAAASKPAQGKSAFHKHLQKVQPQQEGEGQDQKTQSRAAGESAPADNETAVEPEGDTACAAMLQGVDGLSQTLLAAVEELQDAVSEETADQNPSPKVEAVKTTVDAAGEAGQAIADALAALVQTLEEAVASTGNTDKQPPKPTAAANADQPAAVSVDQTGSVADTDAGQEMIGKIMLMLHQNKNHLTARIKIQDEAGSSQAAQETPQQTAPGQVKKLMDFESQRLSAVKLPVDTGSSQAASEAGDETGTDSGSHDAEAAPNFTFVSRETPGVTRLTVRESAAQTTLPRTEEVFEQIVDQAKVMLKANSSEMQINLKPDFLGKMTIKIMVEDGAITAKFVTDSQHVKQMLESNLASLRQTLENNGLKVDRTEVDVQVGNNWLNGSATGQHPSWESGSGYQGTASTTDILNDSVISEPEETAASAAAAYSGIDQGQMSILV